MRLAFVTSLLPTGTPDTGFEIANAAVIRAFRDAGADITLFGIVRPGEEPAHPAGSVVLARMDIENAVAGKARKLGWLAASFRRGLPVIAAKLAPLAGALDAALAEAGPFDAVIVNSAPVAAAFPGLMERWPALLIAHNVEHRSARENARTAGGATGLLYAREARLLEAAERRAAAAAHYVFCLADDDRGGFGIDISGKSAVFPLLTGSMPLASDAEPAHDIGLIGTWTWQPNLAGLRWFMDEVAPRLPAGVGVAVAGRLPRDVVATSSRVTLLGRVPDARAFVAGCRVMALASRSGTGIQLKTIEAFEMGKPAVATPSSVRGIAELPMNCLVADDPASFAAALAKLVNDVKAERVSVGDGQAFAARQRAGMAAAVKAALAALKPS
jgi:Glycosyl transferases group 1